jgi:hypothetical protein
MPELGQLYGPHMRPLTPAAHELMVHFSRWVVAQLHELGAVTHGLGWIDPRWRLCRFDYGKEMLQRALDQEGLAKMIARTFFYGRPKTAADAAQCLILASLAETAGLIGQPALVHDRGGEE